MRFLIGCALIFLFSIFAGLTIGEFVLWAMSKPSTSKLIIDLATGDAP